MSYVNKKYSGHDTVYEDEDWAELVSPTQRGVGPVDPAKNPKDHRNLTHRNAPDQHSIGAITGLVEALASKVDNDSISAERTSEGTVITIGDNVIVIYDNPDTGNISSISIDGKPLPIDDLGNVNIDTHELNVTNSQVVIEDEQSTTVTTVGEIVKLILDELGDVKSSVLTLQEGMSEVRMEVEQLAQDMPRIIFRTWPGLQGE